MLAPLKDRTCLEQEADAVPADQAGAKEMDDLRQALRESRLRLRRGAWQSTQQIMVLNAEVNRLQTLCDSYRSLVERYESGVALINLGRELMRLTDNNERLKGAAHQVWTLEKNLEAAHEACWRLAAERDALAQELHLTKLARLSD